MMYTLLATFTIALALPAFALQPCGSADDAACPNSHACIRNVPTSMGSFKAGVCAEAVFCGGFKGVKCDGTCVDDPRDDCDPLYGGADCAGICLKMVQPVQTTVPRPQAVRCGSKGLESCPVGQTCCVSNLSPCLGALDCPGICGEVCAFDGRKPTSTFATIPKPAPTPPPAGAISLGKKCGGSTTGMCAAGLTCCQSMRCKRDGGCEGVCGEVCLM